MLNIDTFMNSIEFYVVKKHIFQLQDFKKKDSVIDQACIPTKNITGLNGENGKQLEDVF